MNNINLSLYENGSLPSMNIERQIDHLTEKEKPQFLRECYNKIAKGGKLELQFLNLDVFCKNYLFNNPNSINDIYKLKSVTNLNNLVEILKQLNMNITSIRILNNINFVEAVK